LTIVATNSAGLYTYALTPNITIGAVAAAPTVNTAGTPGYTFPRLTLPTSFNSTSGDTYLFTLQTCTSASDATTCTATTTTKSVVATGSFVTSPYFTVNAGANYSYTVTDINGAGSSAVYQGAVYPATAVTPQAPATVAVTGATNSSVTFTWTAPTYDGGSAITGYSLQLVTCASVSAYGECNTPTASGSAVAIAAGTLTKTYTGLGAGSYGLQIKAVNLIGASTTTTNTSTGSAGTYAYTYNSSTGLVPAVTIDASPVWAASGAVTYDATSVYFTWTVPSATGPTVTSYSIYNTTAARAGILCTASPADGYCSVAASKVKAGDTVVLYSTDSYGVSSLPTASKTLAAPSAPSAVASYDNANGILVKITGADLNAASFAIIATGNNGTVLTATATPTATGTGSYVFASTALSSTATYTIAVAAVNTLGSSTYTNSGYWNGTNTTGSSGLGVADANKITLPTAPTMSAAGAGSGNSLTWTWSAGTDAAALTTSFLGTLTDSNGQTKTCTTTSGTTGCTFKGLTVNGTYTFSVVAVTPLGNGTAPTATAVAAGAQVVTTKPGTPTITSVATYSASVKDGSILVVSWTPSANTGGLVLSSTAFTVAATNAYGVSSTTGCASLAATATTCTLTGLAAGTAYTVSIVETNANGDSVAATQDVTTATKPSKPTGITAVLGKGDTTNANQGTATVTWTTPASTGGAPITSYTVTAYENGSSVGTCTVSTTLVNTATCVNLADSYNAYKAYFTVQATNGVGTTTATSAAVGYDAGPLVIQGNLTATPSVYFAAGTAGITVAYKIAGHAILVKNFVLSVYGGSNGTVTFTNTATDNGTNFYGSAVIPYSNGLVLGGTYTFSVAAVNDASTSPYGTASSATSNDMGSSPAANIVLNQVLTTPATFTWDKATSSNGFPVSYLVNVVSALGNVAYTTTVTTNAVTLPTYYAFSGTGAYTISVTALDATGSATANTTIGTTNSNPTVPTAGPTVSVSSNTYSTTSGGSVTLTWSNSYTGGSAITSSAVSLTDPSGKTFACTTAAGVPSTSPCVFLGLAANTLYTYSVASLNYLGSGVATTGSVLTGSAAPSAPTVTSVVAGVSATGAYYTFMLNWTAPASTYGNSVTSYTAWISTASNGATSPAYCTTALTSSSTSCTISIAVNANAGTPYYAFVQANTAAGSSTAGATSGTLISAATGAQAATYTPAEPWSLGLPTSVSSLSAVSGGLGVLSISWTPTGSPIKFSGTNTSGSTSVTGLSSTDGLAVGEYVIGANVPVDTYISAIVQPTAAAPYGSLTLSNVTSGNASTFTVLPSAFPVTGYLVTATAGSTGTVSNCTGVTVASTSCTLSGLPNDPYGYTVTVDSVNAVGASSMNTVDVNGAPTTNGASSVTVGPWAKPNQAATIVSAVSAAPSAITVTVAAPVFSAGSFYGSAITAYNVTATDGLGNAKTCTATALSCTVTGLTAATTYTISVTSTNGVGTGTPVTTLGAIKTLSSAALAAPTITGVVSTSTGLAITWTPPTATPSTGAVLGYIVSATDSLSGQQSSCAVNATYGILLAPAVTCAINGLKVGDAYVVAIQATNGVALGAKATQTVTYTSVLPEPVIATFLAVTAKQKSVSALSATAKTALGNLISTANDGASITITGYGTTKAIAQARANAAASYLFNNGAAVHVTIKTVISKTVKTALVTVTSN